MEPNSASRHLSPAALQRVTLLCLLAFFSFRPAYSQFISKGKITYERKTNQHALMDDDNRWDEMAKKNTPKFISFHFDLFFDNNKLLYRPGGDPPPEQNRYWGLLDGDNIISTQLDSGKQMSQKNIFGQIFLIADSLRKTDWKICLETRKIAGLDCRKAVGKIMDSIVVIAFYTDEIISSGGPESFTGLSGMILGIAIPKMHTTWYATTIIADAVQPKDLEKPKKGKKIEGYEFRKSIADILSRWGDEGKKMIWQIQL